jgi:hypothetical protein
MTIFGYGALNKPSLHSAESNASTSGNGNSGGLKNSVNGNSPSQWMSEVGNHGWSMLFNDGCS